MTNLKSRIMAATFGALLVCNLSATAAEKAPACDPGNGGITLPAGFCALVAIDNLGTARHMAVAPNGDLYVALQGSGEKGGVVALRDTNGDGRFEVKEHFGAESVTGVALHNGYLYIATPTGVERYKMTAGKLSPSGDPETIVTGIPFERQHGDKGIAFDGKGSLYINVERLRTRARRRIGQRNRRARTLARFSKSTAASGSSTRTS